jgi:hypothetical protein
MNQPASTEHGSSHQGGMQNDEFVNLFPVGSISNIENSTSSILTSLQPNIFIEARPPTPENDDSVPASDPNDRDQNPWTRILLAIGAPIAVAIRCIAPLLGISSDTRDATSNLASAGPGVLFVLGTKIYYKFVDPDLRSKILKQEHSLTNSWSRSYKTGAIVAGYAGILLSGLAATYTTIPVVGNLMGTFLIGMSVSGLGAAGALFLRKRWSKKTEEQTKNERSDWKRWQLWADDFDLDNPISRSCKSSAILGNAVGALLVNALLPEVGWLGVAIGGSAGGLAGGALGFFITPLYQLITSSTPYQWLYPKSLRPIRPNESSGSNNPWSVRIRGGMQWGASAGALCFGLACPGLGTPVGVGIGTLAGALVSLAIEPARFYFSFFKKLRPYRTANPWSGRLRTGTYMGTFVGGAAFLCFLSSSSILGTVALGAAAGGTIGGVMGIIIEPFYLYLFHRDKINTLLYSRNYDDIKRTTGELKTILETTEGNPWNAQVSVVATLGSALGYFMPSAYGASVGGLIGAGAGGLFCVACNTFRPPKLTRAKSATNLQTELATTPTSNSQTTIISRLSAHIPTSTTLSTIASSEMEEKIINPNIGQEHKEEMIDLNLRQTREEERNNTFRLEPAHFGL